MSLTNLSALRSTWSLRRQLGLWQVMRWQGTPWLCAVLAALALLVGCEGELGLRTANGAGGPPVLMPSADAGVRADASAITDAAWARPDAFVAPGCAPACAGAQCGSDGCGGSCGSCAAGSTCSAARQCEAQPPTGGTHAVTLYGTSSCGYCRRAREFFAANHVAFTDRDLEAPGVVEEAFERVHDLTGEYRVSTPTVIIDDQVMLGWSEPACRELLGL